MGARYAAAVYGGDYYDGDGDSDSDGDDDGDGDGDGGESGGCQWQSLLRRWLLR